MYNIEAEKLLEEFLGLPVAAQIMEEIDRFPPHSLFGLNHNRTHARSLVVGRVFEEIAYHRLEQGLLSGQRLLSPDTTLRVFERAYPTAVRIGSYSPGLANISLPDGIILNRSSSFWLITAMVEYKLKLALDLTRVQHRMFINPYSIANDLRIADSKGRQKFGSMLHEIDSEIASDPVALDSKNYKRVYVVPQNSGLTTELTHPRIQVVPLDFTSQTFSDFATLLIEDSVATR